jgi:hypothetical protein
VKNSTKSCKSCQKIDKIRQKLTFLAGTRVLGINHGLGFEIGFVLHNLLFLIDPPSPRLRRGKPLLRWPWGASKIG